MSNPLIDEIMGLRKNSNPEEIVDLRFRSGHKGRYKIIRIDGGGLAELEDVNERREIVNFNDVESLTRIGYFHRHPEQAYPVGTTQRRLSGQPENQQDKEEEQPEGESPEGGELGEVPGSEGTEQEEI